MMKMIVRDSVMHFYDQQAVAMVMSLDLTDGPLLVFVLEQT
jgi:hypothetical protein